MFRVAIVLVAALTTMPTYAQIFKCTDSLGGIEYRDGPCPSQTSGTAIDIPTQTIRENRVNAEVPNELRTARTTKRPDLVAKYSFPGPRSIPPSLPVAALPPPPPK